MKESMTSKVRLQVLGAACTPTAPDPLFKSCKIHFGVNFAGAP